MKNTTPESQILNSAYKTVYQIKDVTVFNGNLNSIDAFCFVFEFKGEMQKGIITSGKLRRGERRKCIKKLLLAIEKNYLGKVEFVKTDNVRGAYIRKHSEVKNT